LKTGTDAGFDGNSLGGYALFSLIFYNGNNMEAVMRKILTLVFILLLTFFSVLLAQSAGQEVRVIMKDGSILTGAFTGQTGDELFIEVEKGKAMAIKKPEIKAVFDSATGQEISMSGPDGEKAAEATVQQSAPPAFFGFGRLAKHNPKKTEDVHGQKSETDRYRTSFELFVFASLNNSYAIGDPLQTWMQDDVKSGSPAFFNIGGTFMTALNPERTLYLGAGGSLNLPPSHSIWGSNLYYGGRDELVLNPYILSIDLPFRFALREPKGLCFTASPSLLLAFLSGYYNASSSHPLSINGGMPMYGKFETNIGSMGMGFGMAASAEYFFRIVGISAKFGFRILNASLNFDSSQGPWSPMDAAQKSIGIDLGGASMAIGVLLQFGH
jgi:hypothetical protein